MEGTSEWWRRTRKSPAEAIFEMHKTPHYTNGKQILWDGKRDQIGDEYPKRDDIEMY
jgi:hypothetical protein